MCSSRVLVSIVQACDTYILYTCVCVCVCVCFPACDSDGVRVKYACWRQFSGSSLLPALRLYHAASHPTRPQARSAETPINMKQL